MDNGILPNNEDKKHAPVDTEKKDVVESGFQSPREDGGGFLSAYFDGPYERPFRKRERSPEAPDGTTLAGLVDRIRR